MILEREPYPQRLSLIQDKVVTAAVNRCATQHKGNTNSRRDLSAARPSLHCLALVSVRY